MSAPAQVIASEAGVHPARTWDIQQIRLGDDYPDPPFFALAQSQSGLIYASDRRGVLEFDGLQWRRLPLDINSAITVLGVTRSGTLVMGGAETILAVEDPGRSNRAVDVGKLLSDKLRGVGEFWEFAEDPSQWCLRSTALLVCRRGQEFVTYPARSGFGRLFQGRSGIFVDVDEVGLSLVTSRGPEVIPGGEGFIRAGLQSLVEFPDGTFVAVTNEQHGFWHWRSGQTPSIREHLSRDQVAKPKGIGWNVARERIALPEDNGGVAILDTQGHLVDRIDPIDLGVGTGAQALMVDREGALWIAWRSAISRVEYPSRMRVFALPPSLFGQSMVLSRTKLGITAFHGNTVRALQQTAGTKRWEFQPHGEPRPSILMIQSIDGYDLVGTAGGIGSLQEETLALPADLVFSAAPAMGSETGIWTGLRNGVARLTRAGPAWIEISRSSRVSFDVVSVMQSDPQTLWLGSLVGRAARVRLGMDGSLQGAEIDEFDQSAGLPKATISLEQVGQQIFFWAQGGHFYEFRDGTFHPSRIVPAEESGPINEVKRIDEAQLLVSSPNSRLRLLRRDITGVYRHQPSIFDEIASVEKTRSMHVDPDGIVWLAQDSKVVRIDPKMEVPKPTPQQVLIRDLSVGDRSLLGGRGGPTTAQLDAGASLRVEFTLPSYRAPELNRFRSRIRHAGEGSEWSGWSNETRRDFTNLPAGELLFEVEAEDAAGVSGGVASVPITVIAPWYQRGWAIVAFSVAGLLLIAIGVQWRVRALRMRGVELERLVMIKTDALQVAANTDPLTGLWNRHRFGQWLRKEMIDLNAKAVVAPAEEPVDLIVCVIDLDHFKRVNDQHGHAAGDLVLKAVADRLQGCRRPNDLIFRFGGEEFVYLGTQRHRDEGAQLAESLVREIAQVQVELEGGVLLDPTASVGWSVYPLYRERADLFSLDFVLGIADRALYIAKRDGRNRACGFLPNLPVDEIDRTQADWRAQVLHRHPDFLRQA
ncbi:MAG: diguanylate cyclase [Xanthomonadales bacterium]|nr:diguanylate cyclase [Xanthomonadales bacterium]